MTDLLLMIGIAAICCAATWLVLKPVVPWLAGRAVAQVNARSSHVNPTPQGGGLAAIPVALLAALILHVLFVGIPTLAWSMLGLASIALMILGFWDDAHGLPIGPRLACQLLAVTLAIAALPPSVHLFPDVPLWLERGVLTIAVLWFVNLTNFMDGIDLISACETISICVGLIILACLGATPINVGWLAATLGGAMLGFAIWNTPPARVFLGDAGSLPIGLITGVLLIWTASAGNFIAALILPLYYVADATLTLMRRALRGERFWHPHREHFYQRAARGGLGHLVVVQRIFALNIALIALSVVAATARPEVVALSGVVALILVGCTLWHFQSKQHAQR